MLTLGIPKEIKALERRVGLTPFGVRTLAAQGIRIFVQRGAGTASGFLDSEYEKAGASMVPDASALYGQADLIQKVKEPLPSEFSLLRSGQIIFGFFHLASPENCELLKALLHAKTLALGFETVELNHQFPILAPMSEIAGALAPAYAAVLLQAGFPKKPSFEGKDVFHLLEKTAEKYPSFEGLPSPGKAVIWGGGVAGLKAVEIGLRLRGEISIIEMNSARRDFLKQFTRAVFSPEEVKLEILEEADVFVGCVHARGQRAARVLTEKAFQEISRKKQKIIVDVAIDQGGNFHEAKATTYENPVYYDGYQNLRFGVANMPSLCGRGASEALTQVTLPYTLALLNSPEGAFQRYPELRGAVNVQDGAIVLDAIRDAHKR